MLWQDALSGQQRVHAVLDRGAHPGQRRAVAKQLAQVAQLGRGDVRLGQKPSPQQMRERLGVDRVGLHPRGGDRLRAQRMGKVHVVAGLLEQLGQPLPAVGRLQRNVRPIRVVQLLKECLAVADDLSALHGSVRRKQLLQLRAVHVVREVPNIKLTAHGMSPVSWA